MSTRVRKGLDLSPMSNPPHNAKFYLMKKGIVLLAALIAWFTGGFAALGEPLSRDQIAERIIPPYQLGDQINERGVWSLLNSGGAPAGYVFETEPLSPIPGFSGAPINILVTLDLNGVFIDTKLIDHNEPIFVSGLGEAPLIKFLEQYRGLSISAPIVVGTPYGDASTSGGLVYLDGVTKATASVRIANDSILGATLKVAREKMQGISTQPPAYPNQNIDENLTWKDLVDQGLVGHLVISNKQIQDMFKDTKWKDDDPDAQEFSDEPYLDLWVIDVGPKSIARAVFSKDTLDELDHFMSISTTDEPILVIETARHGLVSPDFVRNTSPDLVGMEQSGLPIALRDADLFVSTLTDVPTGRALILRTDRRLGFDPAQPWTMKIAALREHGMFQPEIGRVELVLNHQTDERFFLRPTEQKPIPPWLDAVRNRIEDLIILATFSMPLVFALLVKQSWIAGLKRYISVRLIILGFVITFIGWWGQGQLSIVTVLAIMRTAVDGGGFAYLLYDPFSLFIWGVTVFGFVLWGRGLFCGWFCPFGALQEFAHYFARLIRLPKLRIPDVWDDRLKIVKFIVLCGLVAITFAAPVYTEKAAEVEPFKTSITVFFVREWYYVLYAGFWIALSMFVFKGFCRYVCPLGAVMAIGGFLRIRKWIPRRIECGSPCQLCKVKCEYGAIKKSGEIDYSECFQCLDCVTIHDSSSKCVPLILANKRERKVSAT